MYSFAFDAEATINYFSNCTFIRELPHASFGKYDGIIPYLMLPNETNTDAHDNWMYKWNMSLFWLVVHETFSKRNISYVNQ